VAELWPDEETSMSRRKWASAWPLLLLFVSFSLTPVAAQNNKNSKANQKKDAKDDVEQVGDREVGKGMNFYSLEKEIALGKALAQQVEQQSRIVQDPVVAEYVNRVGQNLVNNSDAQVPFTIKVIDTDDINAFALPGGFFFVNAGLILAAESEAELAAVMAHEIAHVAARHGTKSATRAELLNWATIPLIFLGGPIGFGARSAASILVPMKFLQFSRGAEREADYLGLQYLYKTGYDPVATIEFFEKIQAREKSRPGTLAKAFSTHPLTPDRIEAAQKEITTILPDRPEHVVNTSEFDQVVERLQVLVNRGRIEDAKEAKDRPTLRRSTRTAPTDTADTTEKENESGTTPGTEEEKSDEDERPTLRRR
jgi:predicted Zn-dependent protease